MEKVEGLQVPSVPHEDPVVNATQDAKITKSRDTKHYSFYFSILMLAMIALIVAWDVTALSLALPVSLPSTIDNQL